jgi:hypothetical protein
MRPNAPKYAPDIQSPRPGLSTIHALGHRTYGEEQTIKLMEEIVAVEERPSGVHYHCQLAFQHDLTQAYQAGGQSKRTVEHLEYIVSVLAQTVCEQHPDRLASQHELARAYLADGKIKRAVELLKHVVKTE